MFHWNGYACFRFPEPDCVGCFRLLFCQTHLRSANQEDARGHLYLTNIDFLKNGVPASFIAALVVASIGYVLSRLIGSVGIS